MEPPSLLPHVDELVMEYLLFRGFTKSFQAFSVERKRDRAKGFDVEQIISQLLLAVQTYQIDSVLETWKFLTARFFNHLDASYASTIQQLETSLLRLYVVNAVKCGHREKAAEFFQVHADKLNASVAAAGVSSDSWSRWFILPYIEHPETDAYFQVFFGQPWLEAFVTSFRNFLSLVFRNLPLPKILAFQLARLEEPTLKLRLKVSQSEATRLRLYNSEATAKIKKLEEAGRQLHSILRMMVQHSFMEHFAASTAPYGEGNDRTKSRSRSRSYGAAQASVGLSQKQMKEIGELFGISSEPSTVTEPEPVDPRDMPRVAEVYLPVDELSGDEPLELDDEEDEVDEDVPLVEDHSSDPPSPMFSPIVTAGDGHSPDGSVAMTSSTPNRKLSWASDVRDKATGAVQTSLLREFNMLNDWEPTRSAMTPRSRFSPNGQFVAIAKLGNTHVDIWATNPVALSAVATIQLPAGLTSLDWLGPGTSKQLLACTLADGAMMLWDADGQEVFSCPQSESGLKAQHLTCAREAPIAACIVSARDEEDSTQQQVLVLHGGTEEPMQDYLPMDGKQLTCVAWSKQGNVLLTGSQSGEIDFIDVIRPERIHRCNLIACAGDGNASKGNLAAICLSPDGASMLSVQENGTAVMEWSVAPILAAVASPSDAVNEIRGSVIDVNPSLVRTYALGDPLALCDADVDTTIRFLANSDYFVVADSAALRLFKRGDGRAISTFIPNQSAISDLDWHPTSPVCCAANQDGTISVWNVKLA